MLKNHYVSQLIIRRFTNKEKINIFDIKNQKIFSKWSEDIFYKKGIYTDEIEKLLAQKVESPFAKLIDRKIINKNIIELTREDLDFVKRFLLIDSIRTLSADEFVEIFKNFSKASQKYLNYFKEAQQSENFAKINGIGDFSKLKKISELNEDNFTIFNNSLKALIETPLAIEIFNHQNCTLELYAWTKSFLDGYIVFWDSNEEQDFILTDNGLTPEYEPSHHIYQGMGNSKKSYLKYEFWKTYKSVQNNEDNIPLFLMYGNYLNLQNVLYENYSVFNLTSTRSILIINPFFKLYFSNKMSMVDYETQNKSILNYKTPDIFPSFTSINAFEPPEVDYFLESLHSPYDVFKYKPYKLSKYDTIGVNLMFLYNYKKLIGFNNFEKIKDSLYEMILMSAAWRSDAFSNIENVLDLKIIEMRLNMHEFKFIFDHYYLKKDINIQPTIDLYDYLKKFHYYFWKDTFGNKYSLNFLLEEKNQELVTTLTNFNVLGPRNSRISKIKKALENLKE